MGYRRQLGWNQPAAPYQIEHYPQLFLTSRILHHYLRSRIYIARTSVFQRLSPNHGGEYISSGK
jgi:hypothetical protein